MLLPRGSNTLQAGTRMLVSEITRLSQSNLIQYGRVDHIHNPRSRELGNVSKHIGFQMVVPRLP